MNSNQALVASYEESKRIIKEAQENKKLVLFVGAGASISSGMPSWSEAISKIKTHLGIQQEDFLKIPQYYYNERGKKEYTALMRKIFKYGKPLSTSLIHKKIMQFNASTIITTNYDHLIEQAAEENAEVRQVISCDNDIPYKTANKELIKMHGDFEHDNFVLKEDDYLHYSSNFKLIENYIKSIIGSKVILFLGYSFNDPDVKQIFSWIKDILQKDFQRAYLINVDDEYDKNKEDYYKNLGVNVIFAKAWLSSVDKRSEEELEKMGPGNILNDTIDKILVSQRLTPTDSIYEELKDFYGLNYVYKRYISSAFRHQGIGINLNDYLYAIRVPNAEKTLLNIFEPDKEDNHIKKLRDIISHSAINGYVVNGKTNKLSSQNKKTAEWIKELFAFNFDKLRKIRKENDNFLDENHPEMYLIQASISYYLEDYVTGINYLKKASKYFYHSQLYVYYFISELNKKYLSQFIPNSGEQFNQTQNKIFKQLKDESNSINLDQTLRSLPNVGDDQFLNDILHFTVSYSLFQDLYGKSVQSQKEANTIYAMYNGIPAYEQLQRDVEDFLNYELENYLLLDKYQQNVSIYRMYIRSKFISISSPNKENELLFGIPLKERNIHSTYLNRFDMYLILRYTTSVRTLFNDYSVKRFEVDKEGLAYLETISDNILKTRKHKNLISLIRNYWNFIALCGHIQLTQSLVDKVLKSLDDGINYQDFMRYQHIIADFINNARQQNLLDQRITYLKGILDRALRSMISRGYEDYERLIKVLGGSIKELGKEYSNTTTIKGLMNKQLNTTLIDLYSVSSSNIKNRIKTFYKRAKFNSIPENFDLYCNLTENQIILPKEEIEKDIIAYLKENDQSKEETKIVPNSLVRSLVNLYLNDKVVDKKHIKETIDKYASEEDKWLIAPHNFNYKKFNINWLRNYNLPLLRKISSEVGEKVKQQFIKNYQQGNLDKELMNIYFDFFA